MMRACPSRSRTAATAALALACALPACSLSNAFAGFPDFQPEVTGRVPAGNEAACRDFHLAFEDALRRCGSPDAFFDLDRVCPERLNERDPRCADRFRCDQRALRCTDGAFLEGFCEDEALASIVCTDPFDDITVPVEYVIAFEDDASCADLDVVELFFGHEGPRGSGATQVGPCNEGPFTSVLAKSDFPGTITIGGIDGAFGTDTNVVAVSEPFVIALEDIVDGEPLDLGVVVLRPAP